MTRQEFEARYQLLHPLEGDAKRTYLARHRSGAIVMVHFLDTHPREWADGRLGRLENLDPARRERILDIVEDDEKGAVVTRFLMDFHSFGAWMGCAAAGGIDSSDTTAQPRAEVGSPGTDSDRHGGGAEERADPAKPEPTELPPTLGAFPAFGQVDGLSATAPTTASPTPQIGEFTAAFRVPGVTSSLPSDDDGTGAAEKTPPVAEDGAATPEAASAPAAPEGPAESAHEDEAAPIGRTADKSSEDRPEEPGEFTKIFQAQQRASIDDDPAIPGAAEDTERQTVDGGAGSGELRGSVPVAPEDDAARSAGSSLEMPRAGAEEEDSGGEFTRMFRAAGFTADDPPELVPPAPMEPPALEEIPTEQTAVEPPVDAPRTDPGTPAPAASDPGEFTQMFRAASLPDEKPTPPVQPPTAAPPPAPAPPVDAARPEVGTPAPAASDPGEFTQMFRAASLPDEEPSAPVEPPASASPPTAGKPNQAPSAAPDPKEATASPSDQPGEFTRTIRSMGTQRHDAGTDGSQGQSAPETSTARATPPPQTDQTQPAAKGEFTTMFEKLSGAPPAPPPATPPSSPYGPPHGSPRTDPGTPWPATPQQGDRYQQGLFGGSTPPPPPPVSGPPAGVEGQGIFAVDPELPPLPAQMTPPPAPPPQAGGEYTRMISAFTPPPVAPASSQAAPGLTTAGAGMAQSAAASAGSEVSSRVPRTGLLIGFGGVAFAAFALILYLIMKSVLVPAENAPDPAPDATSAPAAAESGTGGTLPPP